MVVGRPGRHGPGMMAVEAARAFAAPGGGAAAPVEGAVRMPARARRLAGG